jgi:hypothetical protein
MKQNFSIGILLLTIVAIKHSLFIFVNNYRYLGYFITLTQLHRFHTAERRISIDNEFEAISTEAIIAYFKLILQHLCMICEFQDGDY